jgi:hypothetical protein
MAARGERAPSKTRQGLVRRPLSYNFDLPEERCDSRTARSLMAARLGHGTGPGVDRNGAHPT